MPVLNDNVVLNLVAFMLVNGGAGVVGFSLIDFLGRKWQKFRDLDADYKRYSSIVMSVLVGWGVYGFALWMGLYDQPATSQEWATMLIAVAGTVFIGSQVVHGAVDLRPKSRN